MNIAYHEGCEGLKPVSKRPLIQAKKTEIFNNVYHNFGFRVDIPSIKSGRSTDGFMARKLFQKHELFASILGLDPSFIKNLSILLSIISSSRKYNPEKIFELSKDVFSFYQTNYSGRVNITPTIHKLLCHSSSFFENSMFPSGVLTEQAVELSHKYTKKFKQLSFSNSRENILREIFNKFLF